MHPWPFHLPRMSRRAHRLAQVSAWASAHPEYRLMIGGRSLAFGCLTEEAFDDLRTRIANDFWDRRRRDADNRAIHERVKAMADRIADRSFAA